MRIVIAGAGKLGFSIAQLLAEDQFDVVVVEIDPKRKDVIQNTLDVLAIEGNSCSPTTFADPDISASDVLIACTDSDEVNMVTCLMAKNHAATPAVLEIPSRRAFCTWRSFRFRGMLVPSKGKHRACGKSG